MTNLPVLISVFAMGSDENINVQQNHRDSIASSSAGDELRSIPGWIPEPLNVFNGRCELDRIVFRSLAKAARSASSITWRSEQRRSCEIFFAFCKSESSIEIVVLMHQSIL
jgi:hypothetical protein